MKIIRYLSLVLVIALTASCEKHVLQLDTTPVVGQAEFQLHYYNPVISTSANNITRVDVGGKMIANIKAPLNTYSVIPGGTTGRFYSVNPGNVNIKMYFKGKVNVDSLIYDQSVTLSAGKQNVFVHDFLKPPVVFDNGYPYPRNTTTVTDSIAWVKFYNFLYETPGVTTPLRIQYQYILSRTGLAKDTVRINVGQPVYFGETTGWQPVRIIKLPTQLVAQGSRDILFYMRVVDANGADKGKLKIMNSSGILVDYSSTVTGITIARRYHHTMAGFRAVKSPNSSVRVFTAL